MIVLIEIVLFYIALLILAPNLAKNIATILGLLLISVILFYFSAKYNEQIQSWKAFSIFGMTFMPVLVLIWRAYVEEK